MKPANVEALRVATDVGRQLELSNWHGVSAACGQYPDDADPWLGQEIERLSLLATRALNEAIPSSAGDTVGRAPVVGTAEAAYGQAKPTDYGGDLTASLLKWESVLAAVNLRIGASAYSPNDLLVGASYPFEDDPARAVDDELRRGRRRRGIVSGVALLVGIVVGISALLAGINRDSKSSEKGPSVATEATAGEATPLTEPLFTGQPPSTLTSAPDITAPATTGAPDIATTVELTTTTAQASLFSPEADRYFFSLAGFSTAGSDQMKQASEYLSPAWSYAHHLQKSFAASPRFEGTKVSIKPIGPSRLEFCLSAECWTISGVVEDSLGRISDFDLDGRPMSQIIAAWDGDGPGACWIIVSGADCLSEQAGLIRVESIYSLKSTYVSVDVDAGAALSAELTYASARLRTADGREIAATAFVGEPVVPGDSGTWGLRFDSVLPADVTFVTVTVRWEGGENDWEIEIG